VSYAKKGYKVLANSRGQVGSQNIVEFWKMAPLYLIWCIWREQNARSFEESEISVVELKFVMLKALYPWMAA
jgi:hypothetical protein